MNLDPVAKPLTAIVAIDRHGAIGCKNHLPWSIKSDMAFFRKTTTGNIVVMGRKTHDSIGGCLKGRENVILSRRAPLFNSTDSCRFVSELPEAIAAIECCSAKEAFVIGGAYTYEEFYNLVDRFLVTFVDHVAEDADAFLSKSIIDEFCDWRSEDLGEFPAVPGQDQYGFRIKCFTAPNLLNRRAYRAEIASRALQRMSERQKEKAKRQRPLNFAVPSVMPT
ncbi:dihydrofolate reductase [Novosphingobium sp. PP1Y]|uniref:dihydrofolate reductase n=1 Tax=Novosphingobium sp. PP1Y TaxID=702113 RepID=UPI00020EE6CA|nr:dihydrofolate reductase [Novosphingobium sp. PP1Y]CCA91048.1 dihydrofolate reductase [Novosphingobium sp. PP1Y]